MSTPASVFVHSLFGDVDNVDPMFLLVWTPHRSTWFPTNRLDAAAAFATAVGQSRDLYVGCALRARDLGPFARGKADDVVAIVGAWGDIDCAKPGAKKSYFMTRAAATAFLDTLTIQPTLRVWTGGGYHVWFLWREPWVFADAADRAKAAALLRAWQRYLRLQAERVGATLDSTADLARHLRLPGTTNHKWHEPVVLETAGGPRCNPSDLENLVADLPREEEPPVGYFAGADPNLDPNSSPPAAKLAALLARDVRFRKTWARERSDLVDQSPSGYDLALAAAAVRAGWDDADVIALLIAGRRRDGAALKLRVNYYQRTVARARAGWRG